MRKISKSYDMIVESSTTTLINLVNKGLRARMCVHVLIYLCMCHRRPLLLLIDTYSFRGRLHLPSRLGLKAYI